MKLSDYVLDFLRKKGIDTVFYLPGGGCMHLLDSLGASDLDAISMLHEQAVAIACEAHANTSEKPCAALVTTGPGGTNTVTGVLAAYLDSSPCFFLSGQVKTADLKNRYGLRSLGSQEADIISIISPVTKYAVMITEKDTIRYHLERAWYEMSSGRCGPIWIDIPLDIQGAQIEPSLLEGFTREELLEDVDVTEIITELNQAKRPVIIAGHGLAHCKKQFGELIEFLQIPVIPTWKAMDFISNTHLLYAGRVGGMGDRHGNLTMQNADLIISLGSRLDFSITGYDRTEWAVKAKKIVIDIDSAEIAKLEMAKDIIPVIADAKIVIQSILSRRKEINLPSIDDWKEHINQWKSKYPIGNIDRKEQSTAQNNALSTYHFIDALCDLLPERSYVAPCSSGTTAEIFFQAFTVKEGQVIRSNHGLGSMGFEIPNAIGMCVASDKKDVICIAGDGGMQLNIQELAVIRGRNLPVKLFVINNNGYASIRNMQNNHFQGQHVGCDGDSGLYLPSLEGIASAYEIPYVMTDSIDSLKDIVETALHTEGPVICEVIVDGECLVLPRSATRIMSDGSMRSSLLENQYPFLPDEEVEANMNF